MENTNHVISLKSILVSHSLLPSPPKVSEKDKYNITRDWNSYAQTQFNFGDLPHGDDYDRSHRPDLSIPNPPTTGTQTDFPFDF